MFLDGVTEESLADGYYCDPTSISDLRTVAHPGVVIWLTRNFGKRICQRGGGGGMRVIERQCHLHGMVGRHREHGPSPSHEGKRRTIPSHEGKWRSYSHVHGLRRH